MTHYQLRNVVILMTCSLNVILAIGKNSEAIEHTIAQKILILNKLYELPDCGMDERSFTSYRVVSLRKLYLKTIFRKYFT